MNAEVSVHNPEYVVRRRLGQKLSQGDSRQDSIQNMGEVGSKIDNDVAHEIQRDYQSEIEDVLSDMEGGLDRTMMERINEAQSRDEDPEEKLRKFMKVSSLQLALEAYPVFKSIVTN